MVQYNKKRSARIILVGIIMVERVTWIDHSLMNRPCCIIQLIEINRDQLADLEPIFQSMIVTSDNNLKSGHLGIGHNQGLNEIEICSTPL